MSFSTIKILIVVSLLSNGVTAQSETKDKGNVNFHFGTVFVYTTYSIGYESFDFIKKIEGHQIRATIRAGGWNSSFSNKNMGAQSSLGVTYLVGKKNHFFEHSSELVCHFDRGLKGQAITYIGALYRPYLGYRFQPLNKKFLAKIGVGWKEIIQVGFGYRI